MIGGRQARVRDDKEWRLVRRLTALDSGNKVQLGIFIPVYCALPHRDSWFMPMYVVCAMVIPLPVRRLRFINWSSGRN